MPFLFFWLIFTSVGLNAAETQIPWYERVDLTYYRKIDQQNKIPEKAKKQAFSYFEINKDRIPNKNYISILDLSQVSSQPRYYLVHVLSGKVESFLVAHGRGSDKDHDGYAEQFSNAPGSKASSLGFYLTAGSYYGDNGYSLRLHGLERSNSNAYARAIVIHGANYVDPRIAAIQNKIGRSYGCPAVEQKVAKPLIDRIRSGSLLYIWNH